MNVKNPHTSIDVDQSISELRSFLENDLGILTTVDSYTLEGLKETYNNLLDVAQAAIDEWISNKAECRKSKLCLFSNIDSSKRDLVVLSGKCCDIFDNLELPHK